MTRSNRAKATRVKRKAKTKTDSSSKPKRKPKPRQKAKSPSPASAESLPLEASLFPVVAKHFKALGFRVQGEVCGCDLVALKGERIVIVELKRAFNVKLLYQAVRRLSVTSEVYVAVFRPLARQRVSFWQMLKSLCRRLHIGLLIVDGRQLTVMAEPGPFMERQSTKKRAAVLAEMAGRRASTTVGGTTGQKFNTAYLENAVHVAALLVKHGSCSPARLVQLGAGPKTGRMLQHNHYGWFIRPARGNYDLKPGALKAIEESHPKVWKFYARLAGKS